MKKALLPFLLICAGYWTLAQRAPQTLVGNGIEFTSGFGEFEMTFTQLGKETLTMAGGSGAILINNKFYFGGYGSGMTNDIIATNTDASGEIGEYNMDYGHGGLMIGYVLFPEGLVHFGLSTKVGWGTMYFYRTDSFDTNNTLLPYSISDNLFLAIPRAEAELNVTSWFKLNLGVGYQYTSVDNVFYNSEALNGINYELSFMFGWFR